MKAITLINDIHYKAEKLLLVISFVAFSFLCGLYMYLLSSSVIHVVISKEAEAKVYQVSSEIASLEAEYMEIQHSISREVVEKKGYIAAGQKIFIDRGNASLVTQR
ncbi:MAG: hypothetical protein WDZ56_00785 [Candidatus Paceibacterota bacterium]